MVSKRRVGTYDGRLNKIKSCQLVQLIADVHVRVLEGCDGK